ncbi:MAG: DinB family protein, partial [Bacteroidota bacterium]
MTNQLIIKIVLDAWHSKVKEADGIIDKLTDEQLQNEVAPGRNRGIYLLGHLTAVNDMMLPLLSLGEQNYPQLTESFINNPDKPEAQLTSAKELRQYWKTSNLILADRFKNLKPDEWFQKHN